MLFRSRDYFVSDKSLGFFHVALSARATGESAWLLLGLTDMGYAVGVQAFWVVVGEVLGVCGACVEDTDCEGEQTCTPTNVDFTTFMLTPATCG